MGDLALSTILNHPNFLCGFVRVHRERLEERYSVCTSILKIYQIPYISSNVGSSIWVNLSEYIAVEPGDTLLEREQSLAARLLSEGIHLAPSRAFNEETIGWFRVYFAIDILTLEVGLARYRLETETTAKDRMATALGLRASSENRGPWWNRDSYVRANGLIKGLLQEYLNSGTREDIFNVTEHNVELEGIEVDVDRDGKLHGRILLEAGVV